MRSRSHARFTRQRVETACNSADMQGDAFLVTFGRVRPRQLAEIRAAAAPVSSASVRQKAIDARTSENQRRATQQLRRHGGGMAQVRIGE